MMFFSFNFVRNFYQNLIFIFLGLGLVLHSVNASGASATTQSRLAHLVTYEDYNQFAPKNLQFEIVPVKSSQNLIFTLENSDLSANKILREKFEESLKQNTFEDNKKEFEAMISVWDQAAEQAQFCQNQLNVISAAFSALNRYHDYYELQDAYLVVQKKSQERIEAFTKQIKLYSKIAQCKHSHLLRSLGVHKLGQLVNKFEKNLSINERAKLKKVVKDNFVNYNIDKHTQEILRVESLVVVNLIGSDKSWLVDKCKEDNRSKELDDLVKKRNCDKITSALQKVSPLNKESLLKAIISNHESLDKGERKSYSHISMNKLLDELTADKIAISENDLILTFIDSFGYIDDQSLQKHKQKYQTLISSLK